MRRVLLLVLAVCLVVVPAADASHSSLRMKTSSKSTRWVRATTKKKVVVKPRPVPVVTTPTTSTPTPAATTTTPAPAPVLPPVTPAQPQQPAAILPSRTGVELREYSVTPTRNPLASGAIELNVTNYGEDDHDLTVADSSGHVIGTTGDLAPQAAGTLDLSVPAGNYKIYCSLYSGAHDRAGMHDTLVVK